MQRYFIPADQFSVDGVTVTGEDARHLMKVLRARAGDRIICSNGRDREVLAEITELDKGIVHASILEELRMENEPSVRVWVAQSLPKGDKMETVIQKCTELGAVRFIPFVSERTVVQYDGKKESKRVERWLRIAKEAAEQAQRNRIPDIAAPCSWRELLQIIPQAGLAIMCYEKNAQASQFRSILAKYLHNDAQSIDRSILVIVGPEGGFTEKEVQEAEAAGGIPVGLGKRILRTETAAMTALACVLYESGEIGG
jgi:16S rRNA (uracil1498-N3)-methyltransferase